MTAPSPDVVIIPVPCTVIDNATDKTWAAIKAQAIDFLGTDLLSVRILNDCLIDGKSYPGYVMVRFTRWNPYKT